MNGAVVKSKCEGNKLSRWYIFQNKSRHYPAYYAYIKILIWYIRIRIYIYIYLFIYVHTLSLRGGSGLVPSRPARLSAWDIISVTAKHKQITTPIKYITCSTKCIAFEHSFLFCFYLILTKLRCTHYTAFVRLRSRKRGRMFFSHFEISQYILQNFCRCFFSNISARDLFGRLITTICFYWNDVEPAHQQYDNEHYNNN